MSRRLVAVCTVSALGLLAACLEDRFPGEQVMGSFRFSATPRELGCTFGEIADAGFEFEGTFSRTPDNSDVWLTLQGVNREAEFDGQVATSVHEAPRQFQGCNCENTNVRETLRVALLSQSQFDAVRAGPLQNPDGGECPVAALDGGVPTGEGIALPSAPDGGTFDAARACGELVEEIIPGEGCECQPCSLTYDVAGISRNLR